MSRARRAAAAVLVAASAAGPAAAAELALSPAEHRVRAGSNIFRHYCIGCHGPDASGCGPSARLYRPRPANLTASTRPSEYKMAIIRNGGASLGRSQFMPPWVGQLDDDEIRSVVSYIDTLTPKPDPSC
jgi:mono/diheme cytochrome c family protein